MLKISFFVAHLYITSGCCFRLKGYGVRKIMRVLSQGKLKYNITGRNLLSLCDFNDDFLHMEGKFVENVSVVNGLKVWLFEEGASTSDILICDYFVS